MILIDNIKVLIIPLLLFSLLSAGAHDTLWTRTYGGTEEDIGYSVQQTAESLSIECFPTNIGNSWEYKRTYRTIVYDTVNNDTTEYLYQDSLHEEFEAIDTLAGWECFRLQRILFEDIDTFPETWWYSHPDTALLWIAYVHNYELKTSIVSKTNINIKINDMSFNSIRSLARYLHYVRFGTIYQQAGDTIYWSTPKKLYTFPLTIGKSWVAMTDPFLEEREIVSQDSIEVQAGIFDILKMEIKSDWMKDPDSWYQWIGNEGIIKDSLHVRTEAYDSMGVLIGYSDVDDIYELIDLYIQTGIKKDKFILPSNINAFSIYNNPFNSIIKINYNLTKPTFITIDAYDIAGRLVKRLMNNKNQSGLNTISFDSKKFGSGVYFLRLNVNGSSVSKKVTLIK